MRLLPLLLLVCLGVAPAWAEDGEDAKGGKDAKGAAGKAAAGKAAAGKAAPTQAEAIRVKIQQWIEDLRADEFATREAARKELQRHGGRAPDLLEAAQDHADAEVRRTVRALLARQPKRVTPGAAEVAPGDFRALGAITLAAKDEPLAKVLARMGDPLWARFVVPESRKTQAVRCALVDAPFYTALDAVLAPHTLHVVKPFDRLGSVAVVAIDKDVPPAPTGAAGPMRVRVTEVSATRALGTQAPRKYALGMELQWAPFVQVTQVEQPALEVARDPDGKNYQPTAAMNRRTTYGVSSSRRHHAFTVHVTPAEEGCKPHLGVLELRLTMMLRYDPTSTVFDTTKTLPQTENGVTLHAIEPVEGSRGQFVVDFSAKLGDEVADRSLQAYIVEKDGRLSTLPVYGGRSRSADGVVRIRARAYRGTRGAPTGIVVMWHQREERGTLRFRLKDIPLR